MASTKFCPNCHKINPLDAARCLYCQVPLEVSHSGLISTTTRVGQSQSELSAQSSHRPPSYSELPYNVLALFELNGQEPFAKSTLAKVTLGRNQTSVEGVIDLSPLDAAKFGVSRNHALITHLDERFTIQDLNSTNGTWVNESRLAPGQPYPLNNGALVRLGQLTLQAYFRSHETPEDILLLSEGPQAHTQLTLSYLKEVVHPFLEALTDFQHRLEESRASEPSSVRLNSISALKPEAPIGIGLVGAHDAIELTEKWINPWRTINAARLAEWTRSFPGSPAGIEASQADLQREVASLATQIAADDLANIPKALHSQCATALVAPLRELAISRLQILTQSASEPPPGPPPDTPTP